MIQMMLTIALILFAIAIGMAVLRIILGPSMPDRVSCARCNRREFNRFDRCHFRLDEYESFS